MIAEPPVHAVQPTQDHAADAWDEMFDVVNSENMVIGQQRRDVVHKEGLLHRSVHVICCRPNNGKSVLSYMHRRRSSSQRLGVIRLTCTQTQVLSCCKGVA
jgi:hypothetical protein